MTGRWLAIWLGACAGLGVAAEHVKVAAGINPQSTTPSALGVQGLERTDSEHESKSGRTINLQMLGVTQGGASNAPSK